MQSNNFLKVMLGASNILQKTALNVTSQCSALIENKVIKGNYVTREEFEAMKSLVVKLQNELLE
ncbi:MAG: hypothetical protein LN588_01480 [Rickettsia endosymbiont of Bryobia graminum]|nr:hypothetical protein [Rickettsia endosymbiont of Bryobia graminum]